MQGKKKKKAVILLAVLAAAVLGIAGGIFMYEKSRYGEAGPLLPLNERVGVTHADGKYHLTDEPFLLEGAQAVQELGSKVIKLWFTGTSPELYPFASDWPSEQPQDLTGLAALPYYDEVFRMPFSTYILETYEFWGDRQTVWTDGMTEQECQEVEDQFYALACYFYETFAGTGKTFILQNWEGDNALGEYAVKTADGGLSAQGQTALDGMVDWINARQAGVDRARAEYPDSDVVVANAMEVNFIDVERDMENYDNRVLAVDYVVPRTHCDLYSLSCWGAKETGLESVVADKLRYYKEKAPSSRLYGRENIMLGEFGSPELLHKRGAVYSEESSQAQMENVRLQLEYALEENVRYAVYWELYCNELRLAPTDREVRNEDCTGYWLIRPDGSKTATYTYLKELLTQS